MKKLILTITFAALAVSLSAQEFEKYTNEAGTYERITKRGAYLTNKFFDNWFIGVAGGVNYYNDHSDGSFGDNITPAIDVSLGKWMTPSVGLRMQYTGYQAKGLSRFMNDFTNCDPDTDGYYDKKFNYLNFRFDMLWNISNAIGGFRNDRTWNFVPYFGFGVARAWKKNVESNYEFAPTLGLLNNIRLGNVVDLTLDAKYTFFKARLDFYPTNNKYNGMVSLTAGLSFKLGPKGGFKRPITVAPADYTPYNKRISALEDDLAAANARADKLAKDLDAANRRPMPKPETIVSPVAMTVFFNIGQSFITNKDMINLENIAKVIKATDRTFTITGYADNSTGSKQRNEIISRQRAESVKKALVEKFGVNASQLETRAMGGVKEHSQPELDRRAVVVIE